MPELIHGNVPSVLLHRQTEGPSDLFNFRRGSLGIVPDLELFYANPVHAISQYEKSSGRSKFTLEYFITHLSN